MPTKTDRSFCADPAAALPLPGSKAEKIKKKGIPLFPWIGAAGCLLFSFGVFGTAVLRAYSAASQPTAVMGKKAGELHSGDDAPYAVEQGTGHVCSGVVDGLLQHLIQPRPSRAGGAQIKNRRQPACIRLAAARYRSLVYPSGTVMERSDRADQDRTSRVLTIRPTPVRLEPTT